MRNLLLCLRFDGTAYHGWQVQKNAVTVQQVLGEALRKVLGSAPDLKGCSRTDAGVHAGVYYCSFFSESTIPCGSLVKALNAVLPPDIAARGCREVPETFHARYSALWKEYRYEIYTGPERDPFLCNRALFYPYRMDFGSMAQAAALLCGQHDFSSFCAANGHAKSKVRTVHEFEVMPHGGRVTLRVRADGFLYNMVRIFTGTLLYAARGKLQPGDVADILAGRDRALAGPTAPAHGLYLNRVCYGTLLSDGDGGCCDEG